MNSPLGAIATELGCSVALSGDVLVAGARFGNDCPRGEARIYRSNGTDFELEQTLSFPEGTSGYIFGKAVAIDGDLICVGAMELDYSGTVHVFRYDPGLGEWIHEQQLAPSDGDVVNSFGNSVGVSGNWIIVGDPYDDDLGMYSGSAYVFRRDIITGTWNEVEKLLDPGGAANDSFGTSISIDGDTLLIGSVRPDSQGVVLVHRFDPTLGTWPIIQAIRATGSPVQDLFGASVCIRGDLAVVGATNAQNTGAAHVFRRDPTTGAWTEEQVLFASDADPGDVFGASVSCVGDSIHVGASRDDESGQDSGAAYAFLFQPAAGTWTEEQKIIASAGGAGARVGYSIASRPDLVAVGAPDSDGVEEDSGAVHVFIPVGGPGSWVESQVVESSEPGAAKDYFGAAVDISGSLAIAGAPGAKDFGPESGSATVFRFDEDIAEWLEEAKLIGSLVSADDRFGSSVAIDEDVAVVGTPWDTGADPGTGSVYVFRRDPTSAVWVEEQMLVSSDPDEYDLFGGAVDVDGDVIVVGARGDDEVAVESGAVYAFRRDPVSGVWVEERKFLIFGPPYARFGASVSLNGDVLMIGSMASQAIRVYHYDPQSVAWIEQLSIAPWESVSDSRFGESICVSGNRAIVGEARDSELAQAAGAAHVFHYDEVLGFWLPEQKLLPPDGQQWDGFGTSVSISGDLALVGAPSADSVGYASGRVYAFRLSDASGQWEHQSEWISTGVGAFVEFGAAVACHGTRAIVGSPLQDTGCPGSCSACDSGGVQTFELSVCLSGREFIRGDANADASIDLSDAIFSLSQLFGPSAAVCFDAQDANDDGDHDLADPITTLGFLFGGGVPLPPPFPDCGSDPYDAALPTECAQSPCP